MTGEREAGISAENRAESAGDSEGRQEGGKEIERVRMTGEEKRREKEREKGREKERATWIMERLEEKYPDPETALVYSTPFELLIATILSAQSTDQQVNRVTGRLFKSYNRPEDFAGLDEARLAELISSIGLNRSKSRYIIETSRILLEEYGGEVPRSRKELLKLPGVGRKTANVVLACAFSRNALAVDTHVFRVARRLGLASSDRVEGVERELMDIIPENEWADMHHRLIFHGRETCRARKPQCERCLLKDRCRYFQSERE